MVDEREVWAEFVWAKLLNSTDPHPTQQNLGSLSRIKYKLENDKTAHHYKDSIRYH